MTVLRRVWDWLVTTWLADDPEERGSQFDAGVDMEEPPLPPKQEGR